MVRIISPLGTVSEECYEVIEPADKKNQVTCQDTDGRQVKVHKDRLLPDSSLGRAMAVEVNNALVGVCPKCASHFSVVSGKVTCPTHGDFAVVTNGTRPIVDKRPGDIKDSKDLRKVQMADEQGVVVDLNNIAQHGTEVWTKKQLKFDHAMIDVQAHVLLADEPPRKLCFNTYNGTLGKKKKGDPITELQLVQFRDRLPAERGKQVGKPVGYTLKGTLDDIRQQLQKAGYEKAQSATTAATEPVGAEVAE